MHPLLLHSFYSCLLLGKYFFLFYFMPQTSNHFSFVLLFKLYDFLIRIIYWIKSNILFVSPYLPEIFSQDRHVLRGWWKPPSQFVFKMKPRKYSFLLIYRKVENELLFCFCILPTCLTYSQFARKRLWNWFQVKTKKGRDWQLVFCLF